MITRGGGKSPLVEGAKDGLDMPDGLSKVLFASDKPTVAAFAFLIVIPEIVVRGAHTFYSVDFLDVFYDMMSSLRSNEEVVNMGTKVVIAIMVRIRAKPDIIVIVGGRKTKPAEGVGKVSVPSFRE